MAAPTSTELKKKLTFLITGTSSGLGLSLARAVQAAGHTVIATSRNPSATPSLVHEIESHGGRWLALDLASPSSAQVITDLENAGTQIDVLVNNAGMCIYGPVETASEEELRTQMETMFFGPLRLVRAVLPWMRGRRGGVLVNCSSGASLSGSVGMGGYAGAKAGLDGLTRVLAKELAPFNIRTLTVILGTFNTSMAANAIFGSAPLPDDYKGTMVETMLQAVESGSFKITGDKDKAMKALFEVIVGEGVGAGRESEPLLIMGSDMVPRAEGVVGALERSLEVFGEVTRGVDVEG